MNFNKNQDRGGGEKYLRLGRYRESHEIFSHTNLVEFSYTVTPIKVGLQYAIVTFRSMQ